MTTQSDLLTTPPSPPDALTAARNRLTAALEDERKAAEAYEQADEDEISPREYREIESIAETAEMFREHCETELAKLEKAALAKLRTHSER